MSTISVILGVKNEEKRIEKCLRCLDWADEIIVIDDMSKDSTVSICERYKAKIFLIDSKGDINKARNFGIEKSTCEWIMTLDADEIISKDLSEKIRSAIESKEFIAYKMPRVNYFLWKAITGCGWYPDYIIRVFRKGAVLWPEGDVHKTLVQGLKGKKVGVIPIPLIHYSYYSIEQYFNKFNFYTTELSKEYYAKGRRITHNNFIICFFLKPAYVFLKKYFILKGFKDGFLGYFISLSAALVIFISHFKLLEKQRGD